LEHNTPANKRIANYLLAYSRKKVYVYGNSRRGVYRMKFSRRDFVKFGGLSAIATLGFSGSTFALFGDEVLSAQSAESFQALVGTDFYFTREGASMWGRLAKVENFAAASKTGQCYSMVFEFPRKTAEEATYSLFHPKIGNFELFLTEGHVGKRSALIAIINRL